MTRPLRVLVVDDARDMRLLVTVVLKARAELEVVGEADCGEVAFAQVRALSPDAIVLDYQMPDLNGLVVAERVLNEHPDIAIILFTAYLSDDIRQAAQRLGIRMCLSKDQLFELPDRLEALAKSR